jgi:hypothetical protein
MPAKKPALSPETLGILNDEARRGVGSATLLSTLGPVLDQKLEALLLHLEQAKPDLNELLDLRSRIATLRSLKRELLQAVSAGNEAGERLAQL